MQAKKYRVGLALFITLSIVCSIALLLERSFRLTQYYNHIIQEFHVHYEEKLVDYAKTAALSTSMVGMHAAAFLTHAYNSNISNEHDLFSELKEVELLLKDAGISHFSLYDSSGNLFFDKDLFQEEHFHPGLGFHPILQNTLSTQTSSYGYDFDGSFQGFRYLTPLTKAQTILAYAEVSIPVEHIMQYLDETTHMNTILLYRKEILTRDDFFIQNHEFKSLTNNDAYVIKASSDTRVHLSNLGSYFTSAKVQEAIEKDGLAFTHFESFLNIYTVIMLPVLNYNQEVVGVFVSFQKDNKCLMITLIQLAKLLSALLILWLLYKFYIKNLRNESLLEQYKEVVDRSAVVSKTDPKGKITYANNTFEQLSGYTSEELIGKPHRIVRSPSMPSSVFEDMWKTIQQGQIWKGKVINQKKNGENYTVQATIVPIKDENGSIIEYIAIRYDITELEAYREILEIQLSDSTMDLEHHVALVKQYQDAIEKASSFCRFNPQGIITYVNQTMCSISQLSEDVLLHQSVMHLGLLSEKTFHTIMEAVQQGKTWKGIIECQHKKHIRCYLDATFSPIFQKNELKEIMCISNDVTPLYDLYKEIEETQKEVVFTMGAIGESRSKETGNHVKRVAEYSKTLAKLAGLSLEEAELLKQASPMHDIGKVGIPDAILNKPGKLDEHEWNIMKTHAKLGYNMLKHSSRPILKTAAIVALEHHEKWDGSGYPKGLQGEEIHIFGRITAIADVFDALGSDRCYKQAWELGKILQFFSEEKGKTFDPKLIDLFLKNIELFLEIRNYFKDNILS